jgi:hypothetical protein
LNCTDSISFCQGWRVKTASNNVKVRENGDR